MELTHLVNFVIIFLTRITLLRWLTFLFGSLIVTVTIPHYWICFLFLTLEFVLQWLSFWRFWLCCCISFHWLSFEPFFILLLMTILMLIGKIFKNIWEIFHETAACTEFCERVQVGIDDYVPHYKYQVKPYSSPWCLLLP